MEEQDRRKVELFKKTFAMTDEPAKQLANAKRLPIIPASQVKIIPRVPVPLWRSTEFWMGVVLIGGSHLAWYAVERAQGRTPELPYVGIWRMIREVATGDKSRVLSREEKIEGWKKSKFDMAQFEK